MSSACPVTVHNARPQPHKVTITLISVVITFFYFFSVLLPKCVSLRTHCFLSYSFKIVMRCIVYIPFLHVPPFFLFPKIYQSENLVLWFTVSQVCIVLIAGSWHNSACSSALWTLTHGSRGLSRLLARLSGSVFFVTSAKLDTRCLDPVIYCGLESILMLSFLFCVLLGTFFVKEMFPHICDLVNQW